MLEPVSAVAQDVPGLDEAAHGTLRGAQRSFEGTLGKTEHRNVKRPDNAKPVQRAQCAQLDTLLQIVRRHHGGEAADYTVLFGRCHWRTSFLVTVAVGQSHRCGGWRICCIGRER
ncbi:hypothetical protein GCM10010970_22680 [Silvimonas iriomotensis]|uniref:Uncharacterized protein n=1 Tax=Silvimonas iriomotensis TaxID=449662 RepID=A0ABQ2PAD9_9NEIS|nr:hypothetical protein GCM10010970_22680 [Silvimonas iriomotensis]